MRKISGNPGRNESLPLKMKDFSENGRSNEAQSLLDRQSLNYPIIFFTVLQIIAKNRAVCVRLIGCF
jgi:hypothetical protein